MPAKATGTKKETIVARDVNDWAARVVSASTGTPIPTGVLDAERKKIRDERVKKALTKLEATKNPAAVALGRLGGLKGGKARAEALSAAQRSKIAKKAAQTRWKRDAAKNPDVLLTILAKNSAKKTKKNEPSAL